METGTRILDKSQELFLRYGIKSITMDDIARELGISKKTLYQYVDNKADLIQQIVVRFIQEEKERIGEICRQSTDAIEEMFNIASHVTQHLRSMAPSTMYDLQKYYREAWKMIEALNQQHIYNIIRENIEKGIRQGIYRKDINPDIIAKLYVGKNALIVDEEWFPLQDYRRDQLLIEFIKYHMHGIASEKGLTLFQKHLAATSI